MATLELQRPKPLRPAPLSPSSSSRRLSSAPPTPCSPTIIRTPDFILLPSVPTHEPEDNLPSPMALQHQFAIAAHNDAQARRSRQGSSEDHHRMAPTASHRSDGSSSSSSSSNSNSNNHMMHDHDELEEIVEPDNALDSDPAASHDALRDVRNQQLDSLQTVVHSIAEAHFESASSPNADVTQILDDLFASLRRIGGHNAPLSPTFARSPLPSVNQMSDVDRLVLLVDRLTLAYGRVQDAQQAGLLANLNTLAQSLIASERRLARAALESPPRTPRALAAARRRRSAHSPQSSVFAPGSRSSFSSIGSYATLSTSSDEATPTPGSQVQLLEQKVSPAPAPEQQHIDGSTFDMATVRSATSRTSTFSLETLYAPQPPSALGLIHPQSPRSDQASRAASVGERSDSTALPNRKRYSVQTDSAASTALPSYDAVGKAFASQTKQRQPSESDDLPQYDPALADAGFSADVKKPVEAPTLLERRRAKLAAQHSAYAARTPEDLAMVQSSIDRLSTVMPQLDNQRVLSPDEQREAQLHHMMRRLAESSSKRLDDQRSDPPVLSAPRPAPAPPAPTPLPQLDAISELPRRGILKQSESEVPKTPTTPMSVHSASSSRRSSLLPGAFARKISIASIGNALRRASIYDTTKLKPKEVVEEPAEQAAATAAASAAASVDGDKTVRRRRAATQDSRTKSDIADGLASLFNDGKARKGSIPETNKAAQRASQSFRAIDFADDTPRGRDASLLPRASVEEEDGMLDDYSFATFDTTASNHRLSVFSDPPRSPVSWGSSRSSHVSSRRSSQLTTSDAATPTWPKSPLTPISPVASRRSPTAPSKPAVSFAADTLQPPVGARGAASLQTQLREDL
ncbi:conserved hypothetical protein [Sporisorium reilianum SRZ2]|uniref:Uncharacterized protein n=1 Tax=Sporisorium reilianum (strain SRZ2) TaxID=999809 RepID=E6ZNT8_SPORE|nr:conserved hypothetical protein [Sporisorium reilianum SRZ2]